MDGPVHKSNSRPSGGRSFPIATFFHTGFLSHWRLLMPLAAALFVACLPLAALESLPSLQPDPSQLSHLKRTAAILNQSTPTQRGRLKVFFYGQSITLEPWWRIVSDWLIHRYPNVDFTIENRAISGFQADKLAYTAFADVHGSQPDLIILHNYGYENEMDLLLKNIRSGSSAEILLQTDHPHLPGQLNENTNAATVSPTDWWAYRNAVTLPQLCLRYRCALADVRKFWKAYLRQYHLKERDLLRDVTHPNADGNALLAAAIIRYFDSPPLDPDYPANQNPTVQTLYLNPASLWPSKSVELEFSGYRIEALLSPRASNIARLYLDGARASNHPELITFTRPSDTHVRPWPSLTLVTSKATLVPEQWKLTLTTVSTDGLEYTFRVDGTVTGFDGEGTNTKDFVSRSKRVLISKEAWWIPYAKRQSGTNPPVGFQVEWEAKLRGTDELPIVASLPTNSEVVLQIASGLTEGTHRVRLDENSIGTHGFLGLRVHSLTESARIQLASDVYPPLSNGLLLTHPLSGPKLAWPASIGVKSIQFSEAVLPAVAWRKLGGTPRLLGPMWVLPIDQNAPQRFYRLTNP